MSIKGPGQDVTIRGTLKPLKRSAEEAREDARVAAANRCEVQDTQEYDPQDKVLDEAALETPGTPGTPPFPTTDTAAPRTPRSVEESRKNAVKNAEDWAKELKRSNELKRR